MGYDLTLRPREGELDEDSFVELFNDREHYRFPDEDPTVAAYLNPSTEIYFHVRWTEPDDDEPQGALTVSLNFFRPPTFALEAQAELAELVELHDLLVEDPQADGIEGNAFDADQFLRGWTHGNRLAYEAVRAASERQTRLFHLPSEHLQKIWQWNFDHEATAEANGGFYAAPLIGYATLASKTLVTIATLDLERGFLLPRVDYAYVARGERGTFASWDELATALGLTDGDAIDDPWPYWAIVGSQTRKLDRWLTGKRPMLAIDSLQVQDVHATEDAKDATG